ncbi:MAG TPA: TIR domain-containing protein [Sphingomicrobium sp.]|nr:TIR domain-containing protein [Sphingomicrobium sp.]
MNEPSSVTSNQPFVAHPVFVSYATADRKEALAVCKAIERRGTKCWISCRDVAPGQNYQEAIVRAIRGARAMVLVFSDAANNSDEIKKELSLASKHHVPLMALRIEDVEPSDAFAYELSTRQWIDAFESWDRSIDSLVRHIKQASLAEEPSPAAEAISVAHRRASPTARRNLFLAIAALLILAIGGGAWWFLRVRPAAPHSMMVRLTGFSNLSSDLPAGTPAAMRDEIIAAFNDDGVVGVSTAAAPPPGTAPAYALGGSIRRDGDKIKVNVSLTNERSGATLWSNIFSYDADQLQRVPRHIAVDAGNMVRCGLFAASTYSKALPDPVLTDYMQYCHNSGFVANEPGKDLDFAKKVVAAAPDFSWGWSAVAGAALAMSFDDPLGPRGADYRDQAGEAADKAIALDKSNSEALDVKAFLVDPTDVIARADLFKQALAARPLACGCEHHLYGALLQAVGRNREAIEEYQRSTDVLALDFDSQLGLADALLIAGRPDEAKQHFDAAADLSSDPAVNDQMTLAETAVTLDYPAALKALANPKLSMPQSRRAAMEAAYRAMISNDPAAKAGAVKMLTALPYDQKGRNVVTTLAALGANREAMQAISEKVDGHWLWPASWAFLPASRGLLSDPAFPAFAQRLGLTAYWKKTRTKPDLCSGGNAPHFCSTI